MKSYGRDIINAVGAEVDRIEGEIMALNPGCRYVDLETDRGRFSGEPLLRDTFTTMAARTQAGYCWPDLQCSVPIPIEPCHRLPPACHLHMLW